MNNKQKEILYWTLGIVFVIAFVLTFVYIGYHPEIDFLIQIFVMIITSLLGSYFLSLAYQYHKINKISKK
ncbi:MAG: hypothetical protein GW779_03895 [Candidatus Altiarchaeum hamiconexum]|uniref:Uncharacterized protein n=1 Tax=Candidatus Altarchaeum hamiconexum TaxID=1803513 RepID=A0A8J7YV37_9ARCH|nr:hypothetical protein [Candidatus Altarchaeum hamiconexum]OIQ06098.1 MAG: hypothetical protein AUK59_01140 [Candidatus Altarchaeum sp. CG2_30_32_3053]PIN66968.1 MAG: hypothetical protein COV98_05410 [Candidatus Altarchaeum sp. CG12_big_fil_rev_8_21_14_0_65_33_22]PIV28813.1 MAG: hypothetical protein COS36_00965 [Candidatus Altarchaeum sp. CG03_land_8_20_14_0_80_32_618]PIZ32178.1 MAG: hypothetical protein COY41_01515 [Candidatus Altarchaeum sp. CG_4_10_14_0_8_um_filter_32_851]PJC16135.1 MAG: h